MGYVIVVLLAALAGALVYWASMRFSAGTDASEGDGAAPATQATAPDRGEIGGETANGGEGNAPPTATAPGTAYIPVVRSRGSWQGRLGGVMGLVIAVAVAAATMAFLLYEVGHIISKLLTDATPG